MTLGKSETAGKYIIKRGLLNKRAVPDKCIIDAGLLTPGRGTFVSQETGAGFSGNDKKASVGEARVKSGQYHRPFRRRLAHHFDHHGFNVVPDGGEIHQGDAE